MFKVRRNAYLCDGTPGCHESPFCGVKHNGQCTHTTDIMNAINRKKLVTNDIYYQIHMHKIADSDSEEWWVEG